MKKIVIFPMIVVALCIATRRAGARIIHEDGGVHDINSTSEEIWVYDSPTNDFTTVNVLSGASIQDLLKAYDYSQINIYDGIIGDGSEGDGLYAYDNSNVTISGGLIDGVLYAYDSSTIAFSGGSITGDIIAGSDSNQHDSVITIYGSDFNYGFGELLDSSGTLTGTLTNGDPINNDFYIYSDSSIMLVPEPATLLLLGLGGLVLLRKHRA